MCACVRVLKEMGEWVLWSFIGGWKVFLLLCPLMGRVYLILKALGLNMEFRIMGLGMFLGVIFGLTEIKKVSIFNNGKTIFAFHNSFIEKDAYEFEFPFSAFGTFIIGLEGKAQLSPSPFLFSTTWHF